MRLFISLEIPQSSKHELKSVQEYLKHLFWDIRLTDNDKLHLTIAFIGEQEDRIVEQIKNIMAKATQGIPPFWVTPAYIDGFPSLHLARTLWVGIKGDTDKLFILQERIKDGLISLNLEVDGRRYVPHIAVGKLDNFQLKAEDEVKLQKMMSRKFQPIRVDSLKLFESIPEHGFHTHNTLAAIPLKSG